MSNSIWATLSAINCNEHIEKKGQFSYLAWTWALAMTREHYPDMTHAPQPDVIYADGSMEVRCTVSIEGQTHPMWLPVLDFKNKAIANPNAFDINTARMRCLVSKFWAWALYFCGRITSSRGSSCGGYICGGFRAQ